MSLRPATCLLAMMIALVLDASPGREGVEGPSRPEFPSGVILPASPRFTSTDRHGSRPGPDAQCDGTCPQDCPDEDDGWQGGGPSPAAPSLATWFFSPEADREPTASPAPRPPSFAFLRRRLRC